MKVKDTLPREKTSLGYSNLLLHMKQAVPTTMQEHQLTENQEIFLWTVPLFYYTLQLLNALLANKALLN